jgi:hypothetical protein
MSIYLPHNDTVFIHIPKTGGTSILRWMKDNFEYEDRGDKHLDYWQYHEKYGHPVHHFACVRNPYARVLSWFHYMGEQAQARLYAVQQGTLAEAEPWDEAAWRTYKRGFKIWVREAVNNPAGRMWSAQNLLKPQADWFEKDTVDFVLRTESLNEDFKQVQDWLGCHAPLQHLNKSNHEYYRDVYDFEMKLAIQRIFEKDLDTFKYTF